MDAQRAAVGGQEAGVGRIARPGRLGQGEGGDRAADDLVGLAAPEQGDARRVGVHDNPPAMHESRLGQRVEHVDERALRPHQALMQEGELVTRAGRRIQSTDDSPRGLYVP